VPARRLPAHIVDDARRLRQDATDAESLLWRMVRDRRFGGFKFRRQFPVPPYVLDFYCRELRLGIEIDGGQHSEPAQVAVDGRRTEFLEKRGIRVARFWNNEILGDDVEGFAVRLWEVLHEAASRTKSADSG
jgi:very-short-patch-repair endonuclease